MAPKAGKATELAERWRGSDGLKIAAEVLARLTGGASLEDLPLGRHEGRIDLRALPRPDVRRTTIATQGRLEAQRIEKILDVKQGTWEGLDLSEALLESARFMNARIVDCRFDDARCRDWRLWRTDVTRTSFRKTDMRGSVLGAWYEGRGVHYSDVDFSGADLRDSMFDSARLEDMDFSNARLDRVNFEASDLVRCRFAGLLNEVTFYGPEMGFANPAPRFEGVDLSGAQLHWVDFRRIDPGRARLPQDADHLIVENVVCVLDRALAALAGNDALEARVLRGSLEHRRKWLAPDQRTTIFSRHDLADGSSEAETRFALEVLARAQKECRSN
jgi:uncharacterized protein YjbI with pentapeptide repeats